MSAEPIEKILYTLSNFYTESHRHYHTLSHIAYMFDLARKKDLCLTIDQTMAVWFHDAIYNPLSADNEEMSVELYEECVRSPNKIVKQIILDTKKHIPTIPESKVVLDLDMAILGAPVDIYDDYYRSVRQEYSLVPDEIYNGKRIEFLKDCIQKQQKGKLYHSSFFEKENRIAYYNMQREIDVLSKTKVD